MLCLMREVLEYIENRIDIEHCRQAEKRHIDAMDFKDIETLPLTIEYPANTQFHAHPYIEAYEDADKMFGRELISISDNLVNSVSISDDFPLQIRANYGIGIIASLFGAEILVQGETMPWVLHLDDEAFRKAISHGIPSVSGGIAQKVKEAYLRFNELLQDYSKCGEAIRITQLDMQGPFDTLHLLRGQSVFYDMFDDPKMLHEALGVITETMIEYKRSIMPLVNDSAGQGKFYIHGAIYGGSVLIKDDTAFAMISEAAYEEFCAPYNNRIFEVFGGKGSLHFCGSNKKWHSRQVGKQNISCLNFGNPEMNDLFGEWGALSGKIQVVGYGDGQPYSFIKGYLEKGLRTGVTLKCKAGSEDEAKRILEEHYGFQNHKY